MAIPSSGIVAVRLHEESSIIESSKQSVNFKPLLKNSVSNFLQLRISITPSRNAHIAKVKSVKSDDLGKTLTVAEVLDIKPNPESGGGGGGNGNDPPIDPPGNDPPGNGGNGGSDDGSGGGGKDENEFGPLMKFEEVMKVAETKGVNLPSDMVEAAKATGLRKLILTRYIDLQGSGWPLGFLMEYCAFFRNRMLADPSFLFKVGSEIVIDSCCATFAEVQKRGKDFWDEFELYAADLLVGIVVDIALIGMLAPYARFGKTTVASGDLFSGLKNSIAALPSSVFEFERPDCRFSAQQRLAAFLYKGILYGAVGFGCGIIGQGIANMIMNNKRSKHASDENLPPVPPLVKSAVLWGVFLAVSSNTRYQVINGLESVVESSLLAKQVPVVAMAFTYGVRYANNIYGGMQFLDWARWSGIQ